MKIKVNNKPCEIADGANVAKAIEELAINPTGIAIAVNGKVVPKAEYDSHILSQEDDMVIIKAFYGG